MGGYNANEQSTFESTTSYEILPGIFVEIDLATLDTTANGSTPNSADSHHSADPQNSADSPNPDDPQHPAHPPRPPDSPQLIASLTASHWLTVQRRLRLSPRQRQIITLFVERNYNLGQAAFELGIEPRTAETHIERMHKKLGVSCRTGLLCRVFEQLALIWLQEQRP